jgi:acyl carrier protein
LADDDSLFERADADSLSFIALLRAVELRYGLSLIATDLLLSDFSSIGAIARYVAGRVASDEWGETGI